MADVQAIFGTLLALGIAFPGMLTAWWLLFPNMVRRAQARIERTPWRTFWLGLGGAILIAIPIVFFFAIPLPFSKFLGAVLLFATLGFAGIGTAGIVAKMREYLNSQSGNSYSSLGGFVRSAVAFELAAAFPIVGWFIVIPGTVLVSLGAAIFALLRWTPEPITEAAAPESAPAKA